MLMPMFIAECVNTRESSWQGIFRMKAVCSLSERGRGEEIRCMPGMQPAANLTPVPSPALPGAAPEHYRMSPLKAEWRLALESH